MFLALSASSSHSSPFTYSIDATQFGTTWAMDQVIDSQNVSINSVVYKYTAIKPTESDLTVSVYNEGVFRETDDWSGLPSGSIVKYVPLPVTPISEFGQGGIDVVGDGEVVSTSVRYNYRIESILETANNSIEYVPIINTDIDLYNVLEDDAVSSEQADPEYSDEEEGDDKESDTDRRREALRAADAAIGNAMAISQDLVMQAMVAATDMTSYYAVAIQGGVYDDNIQLLDTNLPDSKQGLRNGLAQQILHTKMVDAQYRERSK